MITAKHLTKKFGSFEAVNDVSFEAPSGGVVGFLGPNGAGKTTTMRLISGYLTPTSGDVLIDGVSVRDEAKDVQKELGYMSELNPLYSNMLVSEILSFTADLKGISKVKQKDAFDFVVNAVSLEDVFNVPIEELSKGYKQRVGLALAILDRPKVLLLDEPTEGLDPNQRTEIRKFIKELAKDRTIIISTHVLQEAQAICDRLLVISNGKLVADGTTEELIHSSGSHSVYEIDIEGKNVEKALREISGVERIEIHNSKKDRIRATIFNTKDNSFIQPAISKLIAKNNWTVWKLMQKEEHLEDVFQKLTNQ